MYDVLLEKPEPLVAAPPDLRASPSASWPTATIYRPLDERRRCAASSPSCARAASSAVAVCLLHAYRHPEHERRVARHRWPRRAPELRVSLSHEVVARDRASTSAPPPPSPTPTCSPSSSATSRASKTTCADARPRAAQLLIMLSSGGTATVETARRFPVRLIESGPAGGRARPRRTYGRRSGRPDLLSFDMGGTTAKACLIEDGEPTDRARLRGRAACTASRRARGLPIKCRVIELIEIGAGGGSIARVDRLGLLKVGPDTAGAEPGPGLLRPRRHRADRHRRRPRSSAISTPASSSAAACALDRRRRRARDRRRAGRAARAWTSSEAAWGIHQVVNENMANAARIHAVERGTRRRATSRCSPSAAPARSTPIASPRSWACRELIAPFGAGVGSTIGLLAAPLAFDFVRTARRRLDEPRLALVNQMLLTDMEPKAAPSPPLRRPEAELAVERPPDMRLIGQAHEITVDPRAHPATGDEPVIAAAFERTYNSLFGRTPPNVPIEVVSWRVRVTGPNPDLRLGTPNPTPQTPPSLVGKRAGGLGEKGQRPAYSPSTTATT